MISRASFGIFSSIGALLLFAIWPNVLPLQQHFAMAQIIPGAARAPTFGSAPANTTTGSADPGDPAGEEVVPPWYGGTPCHDETESSCAK